LECGENNKFGHPNNLVLQRLENFKIETYRTDEDGEISIIVNKKGNIIIKKYVNRSSNDTSNNQILSLS